MTTDFRALCAELLAELENAIRVIYREDGARHISSADPVITKADIALAQPAQPEERELTDEELGSIAADRARRTASEPPADGEVGELVKELRRICFDVAPCDDDIITRAADLLAQHHPAPVPVAVSERLPEPSVKVLAHYFNDLGKGRTICAIWVPAKTRSDNYGDDDFTEYDEESDTFYWPESWYETIENWDDFGYVKVDEGEVVYWQPLPKWPTHALPLPAGEVE